MKKTGQKCLISLSVAEDTELKFGSRLKKLKMIGLCGNTMEVIYTSKVQLVFFSTLRVLCRGAIDKFRDRAVIISLTALLLLP